jgi:biopolymer transport protein ExbD
MQSRIDGSLYIAHDQKIIWGKKAMKRAAGDAKDPVVIVNADGNATHQSVIHVMEAARAAGLIHITFATQTPGK